MAERDERTYLLRMINEARIQRTASDRKWD